MGVKNAYEMESRCVNIMLCLAETFDSLPPHEAVTVRLWNVMSSQMNKSLAVQLFRFAAKSETEQSLSVIFINKTQTT